MNIQEIVSAIETVCPGAVMCRRSNSNFLAVPGPIIDGVQTYHAVKVSSLLYKDTKTTKAFDLDEAVAEYNEFAASQAEKAARPKKTTGADPAKQAAKEKRKDALALWLSEHPGEHTCTEIKDSMPDVYGELLIMQVGSDAKELANEGRATRTTDKGKNFYSGVGE